jgi:hypothetical protein
MEITCIKIRKDHFMLIINGKHCGEFERSQLRHIIEKIDNAI